jgi:hypothetical protein
VPRIPKLFVGSSSETLTAATAVKEILSAHADVTVWQDGFLPGQMLLLNIVGLVTKFDFGLFLFSPDDMVKIRRQQVWAVRDNVLFEAGVFMGGLGIERTFLLVVGGARTPSDIARLLVTNLLAISTNMSAATRQKLTVALDPIVRAIHQRGPAPRNSYDELLSLAIEIDQSEFKIGARTYVLGTLVRKAANARRRPWYKVTEPRELFAYLAAEYTESVVDEVYWWLVVMGILRFKGIETFTSSDGCSWRHSIEYVQLSERGVRLLNQPQTRGRQTP